MGGQHRGDLSRILGVPLSRREALRRLGVGGLMAGLALRGMGAQCVVAQGATPAAGAAPAGPADVPIDHVIVVFMENHTFDNMYGLFPGANGLNAPGARIVHVDKNGTPYATLPPVVNAWSDPPAPDTRFPADLPNAPFRIDQYVPDDQIVPSPVHRFYQHQLQLNGGKPDLYVAWNDSGAMPMGYHDTNSLPLAAYAREFTLADNFFTAAFGGSMLNHFWLICAATPVWPNAPAGRVADPEFDATGRLIGLPKDGDVTPDEFVVNDAQPYYKPYMAGVPAAERVPPQTLPTIGDRLSAAGVSWAWYAGGWNDALAGRPDKTFEFHHQPFVYFEQFADGTAARADHLKDESDFVASVDAGTLPAVSFIKPVGTNDEHAGYATTQAGERHVSELIERVRASAHWDKSVIIVTYDDFGGWYDHVAPTIVDRWGPGGRVPALIVSPHARRGFVDHTLYDTTSILRFIEWRYGLAPLTDRDTRANNLLPAFEF